MSRTEHESAYQFPASRALGREPHEHIQALTAELQAARTRTNELVQERADLLQRQNLLTQEFEHRLVNSLQLIVSLLSLRSRAATTAESAAQLTIAAARVAALGRVHRRLHLLDHQKSVEFKQYLQDLCDDLSGLLFQEGTGRSVVVTGADVSLPSALGIPLGFIVNELITNCVKYAKGNITVRIETSSALHSLSVTDEGPGLPEGFNPAHSSGLGMKIVRSLVREIDGTLHFSSGDGGTRFRVAFARQP
jgi:two-component system, sensor histidine kinase PdtaS